MPRYKRRNVNSLSAVHKKRMAGLTRDEQLAVRQREAATTATAYRHESFIEGLRTIPMANLKAQREAREAAAEAVLRTMLDS